MPQLPSAVDFIHDVMGEINTSNHKTVVMGRNENRMPTSVEAQLYRNQSVFRSQ